MHPRIDCHVHLEAIGGSARPSAQPGPTLERFAAYVEKHRLDAVWGIFETEDVLLKFSRICPIFPLFWVRDPSKFEISTRARGIKLHPYRDGWTISLDILTGLLESLRPATVVLIHCDDRSPETISATRPRLFAQLADRFPDLIFVIGHSGSYAPNPSVQPRASLVAEETTTLLVTEAVQVAAGYPNVYLDTSILVSPVKAELLARKAPQEKLLLGTDFPIGVYRGVTDYDREERTLADRGASIELVRRNAAELTRQAGLALKGG